MKNDRAPTSGVRRVENTAGPFFVTDACISCGACWASAPDHFTSHELHTYAFVAKQPQSDEEAKLCEEALERCPVSAIGQGEA